MENQDILKATPLFSCLSEQEFSEIEKIAFEKTFQRNAIIIQEGDETTTIYVVLSGKAVAMSSDEDGKQIILNEFEKGDYFGEMSFIDGKPRCATVQTTETTRLFVISGDKLRKILLANPDMVLNLMKGLLEKVRKATMQIKLLVFSDVYGRVRHLLIELSEPYQGSKRIIKRRLRHHEIATRVNASREMVSRIMSELSEGGYITVCKDCIIINRQLPEKW